MRRLKFKVLSPLVSDLAAFAVLGLAVLTILGIASMKGEVQEATLYQSVTRGIADL
jgi:hypothetical protein